MRAREFIAETASAGATSSGSVATVAQPLGSTISRLQPTRSTKYRNTYKGSKPDARR
jgi:hypothetical protein